MISEVLLNWHNYRYFPYERELADREASMLLNPMQAVSVEDGLGLAGSFQESLLDRLVYFQGYQVDGIIHPTLQHRLERASDDTGVLRKQSTRYSVHGLHEYKGKFNPQIARALINILGVGVDSVVFDPFCGSGTTLVECMHSDIRALGCDINPFAVFISNAKTHSLTVAVSELRETLGKILEAQDGGVSVTDSMESDGKRMEYLGKWFTEEILRQVEGLRLAIESVAGANRDVFLALASDLIRDYSLQEPQDLRIRRRYSALPTKTFVDAFKTKANYFLNSLQATQSVIGVKQTANYAYEADGRSFGNVQAGWSYQPPYDCAVTSPPYVTALPYIDTQRLSLVWLGLCKPTDIGSMESKLTGSREFANGAQKSWIEMMESNAVSLPESAYQFCALLQRAVSESDGFRRKVVPFLMYRYLSDMQSIFSNILTTLRHGAPFALVVGHNHTTLGGRRFDIDTPDLLRIIATHCGWEHSESIPLQTYQRYGLHMSNAVRDETLLILRKP